MKILKLVLIVFISTLETGYATPVLNHIMVIWGENTNYASATAQPYLFQLATTYSEYTNYSALTHPSEPNYIAFACGTVPITADYVNCLALTQVNLADSLESALVDWREYEENLVTHCYDSYPYLLKHDYFSNFTSVNGNTARINKVISFDGNQPSTYSELTGANPPLLVLVTPNMINDGHDGGVVKYNQWLQSSTFFQDMLNSKYYTDGGIFVTFDENAGATPNRVYCVLVSSQVKMGYKASTSYNHYSLLRTLEDNWSLPTITDNDTASVNMFETVNSPVAINVSDFKGLEGIKE